MSITLSKSAPDCCDGVADKLVFHSPSDTDRSAYERCLFASGERSCASSFVNLFCWGDQRIALLGEHAVVLSRFGEHIFYSYPVGKGDPSAAIYAILADAKARRIPCVISGLREGDKDFLDALLPERFSFDCRRGSFDYVYDIHDLADLAGKKYHRKRNHDSRFHAAHPACRILPIDDSLLADVRQMADAWYADRAGDGTDFSDERRALTLALDHYKALDLVGLALVNEGRVLAFTVGSRLSPDTFDVHFEKAFAKVEGAYAAINRAYARYIREKYPEVRFLDREEDMGIEGLRRAKESYYPHHMVEKYRAWPVGVSHES